MVQFISSNPVTDRIDSNNARGLQALVAASNLMDARDRRVRAANEDAASRENAKILVEPSPIVDAQPTQSASSATLPQPPAMSMAPASGLAAFTAPPAELSTPPAREKPRTALSSITADPYGERIRKAIGVAAGMEGGGRMAMQLAQGMQRRQEQANLEALKAIGQGNYDLAHALNQQHGLGLDHVLSNPNSLAVASNLAKTIPAKLEPAQALAYQEAAAQAFQETYNTTKDFRQSFQAAGMAGMKAAGATRGKSDKYLETPRGFFDPVSQTFLTDKGGKVVMPPDRKLYFNQGGGGGGGGGGGASKGAKFDIDQDGNRVILYRDGTMVYPKDAAGNPVKFKAGTDQDQKFVRQLVANAEKNRMAPDGENPVSRARQLAEETGGRQTGPQLPAGIPAGSKQVGTSQGVPVYQAPDGKRYIEERRPFNPDDFTTR